MRVVKFLDVTLARHDSLVKGREGRELVLGWGEGNMKWEEGTLLIGRRSGRGRRSRCGMGGRRWGTPGGLPV